MQGDYSNGTLSRPSSEAESPLVGDPVVLMEGLKSFIHGAMEHRERFQKINAADPDAAWAFAGELKQIFPEYTRHFWDLAVGDILTRAVLHPKTNQLAALAALIAAGQSKERVGERITEALRSGCSPDEIVEAIVQSGVCGSYAHALPALKTARETFTRATQQVLIRKQEKHPAQEGKRRHCWYTADVLNAIRQAGPDGLAPQEIAERFHLRRESVYMWFSRTKKKDSRLSRNLTGRYVYPASGKPR